MNKKPIFTTSLFDFEKVDDNNDKTRELFKRIANAGDDRSKIILSAIVVEYYFDRILQCLLVDYQNLTERTDYTFSLKISILKSLRIIPNEIILMCDCVRKIRNLFAHNIELDDINQIDSKVKNRLIQLYSENVKEKQTDLSLIEKFQAIYNIGSSSLRTFEKNVRLLREKLDAPDFEEELKILNEKRMFEFHNRIMQEEPIEVIDRGNGEIEERYRHSLCVVKKKKL